MREKGQECLAAARRSPERHEPEWARERRWRLFQGVLD
jgi:hypothetical protein